MKKIFEKNLFGSSYISPKTISPCRDWLILLVILFLMMIFSIVFDFLTYKKVVNGEMYVSVEKKELFFVNLEKEKIKSIFDKFQEKKDFISKTKIEPLIDPSM